MTRSQAQELRNRAEAVASRFVNAARSEPTGPASIPAERYEALRREVERTVIDVARAAQTARPTRLER